MSEEKKHDGGTIDRLMATVNCIREIRDGENGPSCHLCGAMMVRVGVMEAVQAFKCLSCGAHTGASDSGCRKIAAEIKDESRRLSLAACKEPGASARFAGLPAGAAGTMPSAQGTTIGVGAGIGRGAHLELPPPSEIYRQARAEGFTGDFYLSVCCGRELLSNSLTRFCPMCGREITGQPYKPAELRSAIPAVAAGTTPTAEDLDAVAAEQAAGEATR